MKQALIDALIEEAERFGKLSERARVRQLRIQELEHENGVLLDEQNAAWRIVEEQAKKLTDLQDQCGWSD